MHGQVDRLVAERAVRSDEREVRVQQPVQLGDVGGELSLLQSEPAVLQCFGRVSVTSDRAAQSSLGPTAARQAAAPAG